MKSSDNVNIKERDKFNIVINSIYSEDCLFTEFIRAYKALKKGIKKWGLEIF